MRPNCRAGHRCIDLAAIRVQQRRVPQPPADPASRIKSFTCRNKARLLCVNFKAQYQAFVRFAVASSAALSAIALNLTCLWNLSPGRALCREFWLPAVNLRGEPTLNRCCDRKVVAPRGYSKRFFLSQEGFIRAFFALRPPWEYLPNRLLRGGGGSARQPPSAGPHRRSDRGRPRPPAGRRAPAAERLPGQ